MKISLNWLRDYIDLADISTDKVCSELTKLGLEVEALEEVSPIKGPIVVGEILEASPHPEADKLQLCSVDVGDKEALAIVCGAPNARKGLKVVCAGVGSVLPGDFKIKSSKIRGQKSAGMLCSEDELGFGSDSDGILELSPELKNGTDIAELFKLKDTVLEIGLTPNRSDCLGYIGIARDLAASLNRDLRTPDLNELEPVEKLSTEEYVTIKVDDAEDCGRFTALYIKGVKPVSSPLWLQKRLENSGMRPINLIVDVTNYVMLEQGQPIHAYDRRDLKGRTIRVRRARDGEKLTSLDEVERSLLPSDIVIADSEQAIGIAGVMGGLNSEVKDDTSEIIVEVASFNPSSVRKTSQRLALHTEASHRFERGVNIVNIDHVNSRVAELLQVCSRQLISSGKLETEFMPVVAGRMIDEYPREFTPSRIALRVSRARDVSGLRMLTQQECISYLERLGFKFLDKNEDRMVFEIPAHRLDIEREVDLIEEVTRLHGYDKIPTNLPMMEIKPLLEKPWIQFFDQLKLSIASLGFTEIISFPFTSQQDFEKAGIGEEHPFSKAVELHNPLVEDYKFMRTSLAINLVQKLKDNQRHGTYGGKLFELGRSFHLLAGQDLEKFDSSFETFGKQGIHISGRALQEERPIEKNILAAILDHPAQSKSWDRDEKPASFFDLKAVLLQMIQKFNFKNPEFKKPDPKIYPWLNPKESAAVYINSTCIGYIGSLHPRVARDFELDFSKAPILFEIVLDCLWQESGDEAPFESGVVKFPAVARDVSLIVPSSCMHQDVEHAIGSFKRRKHLKKIHLFDVYQGKNIPEGKKSMGYSLSFQSQKKTLTDKEVEKELQALLEHFNQQLTAELR